MLLEIVTDEELFASQIIKTILLIVVGTGIVYKLYSLYHHQTKGERAIDIAALLILIILFWLAGRAYALEDALLKSKQYVVGTTTGYCSAFARGEGIAFEYEISGQKFNGCNTFHPVSKDSIKVPAGKYRVRLSDQYPGFGRMDFRLKAE